MRKRQSGFTLVRPLISILLFGLATASILQSNCCDPIIPCPPTPTIHVLSPNGAESWGVGQTFSIRWESTNITGNVMIELARDGGESGFWETIVASTPDDGVESWTVIEPESSNCMIKITSLDGNGAWDTSDGLFTITFTPQPTLDITSPQLGEIWVTDTAKEIAWTSANVTNVKIELSRDNGSTYETLVASMPGNSHVYNWTVTGPLAAQARMKISSVESPSVSSTSRTFTIRPYLKTTSNTFITPTGDPAPTATLGDRVVLTTQVACGAGFPPNYQLTLQATIGKSENGISVLVRDRDTKPIPTSSVGTLTFTFTVDVQNNSSGGRITGTVTLLDSTASIQSPIPCFTPDCPPANCDLESAQVTDFKFVPGTVGPGGFGVTLHMEVTYWASTYGSIYLNIARGNATCNAPSSPGMENYLVEYSPTNTEPPYKGRVVRKDWLVGGTNNCATQGMLT